MSYTPPDNDSVDFTTSTYTPPDNDSTDFSFRAFSATATGEINTVSSSVVGNSVATSIGGEINTVSSSVVGNSVATSIGGEYTVTNIPPLRAKVGEFFILTSDGKTNNPTYGLTSDTSNDGGYLSPMTTEGLSSSFPIGQKYTASPSDQLGNCFTSSRIVKPTTQTESSSSTFGNSSSDTTAGGGTPLVDYDNIAGVFDTSSVVEAFTESFETTKQTTFVEALTSVTGDTKVATADGTRSLENAISTSLVASETALLTAQNSNALGNSYVTALDTSTFTTETTATFNNSAVTVLGEIDGSEFNSLSSDTSVSVFSIVSPTSTNIITAFGGGDTTANVIGLAENAILAPLTPTMSIVLSLESKDFGIEGSFADSLSASVGAETFIKVNKKKAFATPQLAVGDTSTLSNVLIAAANALSQTANGYSTSTAQALFTAALYDTFGVAVANTTGIGTEALGNSTGIGGGGYTSVTPSAAVYDSVLSELDASSTTHANAEVLAEAAQTLTEQGLADTKTEAAALVSNVVANRQRGSGYTTTVGNGVVETFTNTELRGLSDTFSLSDVVTEIVDINSVDTESTTRALSLISTAIAKLDSSNGILQTKSISNTDITDINVDAVEALFRILYASRTGKTSAHTRTNNKINVINTQNTVKIIND